MKKTQHGYTLYELLTLIVMLTALGLGATFIYYVIAALAHYANS